MFSWWIMMQNVQFGHHEFKNLFLRPLFRIVVTAPVEFEIITIFWYTFNTSYRDVFALHFWQHRWFNWYNTFITFYTMNYFDTSYFHYLWYRRCFGCCNTLDISHSLPNFFLIVRYNAFNTFITFDILILSMLRYFWIPLLLRYFLILLILSILEYL